MDARPLYCKDRQARSVRDGVIIALLVVAIVVVSLVGALLEGPDVAGKQSLETRPMVVPAHQITDDD